jgi:hypothetical protein
VYQLTRKDVFNFVNVRITGYLKGHNAAEVKNEDSIPSTSSWLGASLNTLPLYGLVLS